MEVMVEKQVEKKKVCTKKMKIKYPGCKITLIRVIPS